MERYPTTAWTNNTTDGRRFLLPAKRTDKVAGRVRDVDGEQQRQTKMGIHLGHFGSAGFLVRRVRRRRRHRRWCWSKSALGSNLGAIEVKGDGDGHE